MSVPPCASKKRPARTEECVRTPGSRRQMTHARFNVYGAGLLEPPAHLNHIDIEHDAANPNSARPPMIPSGRRRGMTAPTRSHGDQIRLIILPAAE